MNPRILALLAFLFPCVVLWLWLPRLRPGYGTVPPGIYGQSYQPVGSLNEFRRSTSGNRYQLQYGFVDYNGKQQRVAFTIDGNDYNRALNEYGFDEDQIKRDIAARLRAETANILKQNAYGRYITYEIEDNLSWRYRYRDVPEEETPYVEQVVAGINQRLQNARQRYMQDEFAARGFQLDLNNDVNIDYAQVVAWNRSRLRDAYRALDQTANANGYNRLHRLGLFLAFLQEIRYIEPPEIQDGKNIVGLWVPPEVLVNNRGDCDSKSLTLAALWTQQPNSPVIIVRVPGHVLIGVAVRPGPGMQAVRIGNYYYVLCEVSGPGKAPPGTQRSVKGNFEYFTIR